MKNTLIILPILQTNKNKLKALCEHLIINVGLLYTVRGDLK